MLALVFGNTGYGQLPVPASGTIIRWAIGDKELDRRVS
jgi:hypothetical protein